MGIASLYNTLFNYFFLLVSLVMTGFSVYFLIDNTSLLSKIVLGVSVFYLLVALSGIVSRFLNFGYFLFLCGLAVVTIFQVVIFVLITFWKTTALDKLRDMDGGDYSTALTCYNFVQDNTLVVQIIIAALVVIYVGAFISAWILKMYKPDFRRFYRNNNMVDNSNNV